MENKGKFKEGNPGGPGRPPKEREAKFLEVTLSAVTFKDWEEIVKKAVAQAKRGDNIARKWLGDYLIGAPIQRQEITGKDGEKIQAITTIEIIKHVQPNSDEER